MKILFAVATLFAILAFAGTEARAQEDADYSDELLDPELEPDEALILIRIYDKGGNAVPGVVISVQSGFSKKSFSQVSDKDGKIFLVVPTRNTYNITFLSIAGENSGHDERFDIDGTPEQRYSLTMTYEATMSKKFILEGVNFHTGKATLKSSSFVKLDPLVEYLKMKPEIQVELSGHTDNVGDNENNLKLSEARATTVKEYLVKKGVDAKRITAIGMGDTLPIASNDTAEGRTKNRRTEVKILD